MGTLNKLRASLARLDKAILGKVTACKEPFFVAFLLACEDIGRTGVQTSDTTLTHAKHLRHT